MPDVATIRKGIAELPKGPPLVVAFMGGTSGIGSYTAKAFARAFAQHGFKLRVYIVGRNAERAEELLNYGRETSPGSDWRFIQISDLALLAEVDRTSKEIIRQEEDSPFAGGPARLDVLYMSQALSPLQKSDSTREGIDSQMSLIYYSRIRFIQSLTPHLLAALQPAHVISIFAGNMEGGHKPDALPIGTPPPSTYSITTVRNHTVFNKTFLFEALAEQHTGKISFTHIFPGLVDGPTLYGDMNPWWFRTLWPVLKVLLSWYMTDEQTCGDVMAFLATVRYPAKGARVEGKEVVGGVAKSTLGEVGGGAYAVGQRGDDNGKVAYEGLRHVDGLGAQVWKHTMETIEGAVKKGAES